MSRPASRATPAHWRDSPPVAALPPITRMSGASAMPRPDRTRRALLAAMHFPADADPCGFARRIGGTRVAPAAATGHGAAARRRACGAALAAGGAGGPQPPLDPDRGGRRDDERRDSCPPSCRNWASVASAASLSAPRTEPAAVGGAGLLSARNRAARTRSSAASGDDAGACAGDLLPARSRKRRRAASGDRRCSSTACVRAATGASATSAICARC